MSAKKIDLKNYSIDALISWRNNASERVSDNDRVINHYMECINKVDKRSHKDKIWITKLNREINDRAFGYKKTIYDGNN